MQTEIEFQGVLYDQYFKTFFKNKDALKDYINSYFAYRGINKKFYFADVSSQYYISPNKAKKKDFYGDIVVTLDNGEIILLEAYTSFGRRQYVKSLNYMTRMYSNQMETSNKRYEDCKKVTCLNLITSNYRRSNNNLINGYILKNEITNTILDNGDLEMVLIRLDLVDKSRYNLRENRFIRWNKMLRAKSFKEMEKLAEGDEIMEQSVEYVKRYCNSDLNHGFKDIILEERLEASEAAETKTLLNTAKNLLSLNISVEDIMKATGLTKKQIEKLK